MDDDELIRVAGEARKKAHSPYSAFQVGAALLGEDGSIYCGCNVENISFGLTMCAERVAVGSAIANGCRRFVSIAIVSDSSEPVVPCGACRQVLAEFSGGDLRILTANLGDKRSDYRLDALLPKPRQGILG